MSPTTSSPYSSIRASARWRLASVLIAVGFGAFVAVPAGAVAGVHKASSPTVQVRNTKLGKILVNGKGDTLYLWAKDKHGKSVCTGGCLSVWPLVLVSGKPTAGHGVQKSKLGEYKVSNGKFEVTYNHHPLYTFVSDTKPGAITGQGNTTFGGPWWVVSPAGNAITKKP
ncbi:MAG: COG4315 family predicted lipoprotein [Solirubrobacteraceae bacterium]